MTLLSRRANIANEPCNPAASPGILSLDITLVRLHRVYSPASEPGFFLSRMSYARSITPSLRGSREETGEGAREQRSVAQRSLSADTRSYGLLSGRRRAGHVSVSGQPGVDAAG